MPSRYKHVLYWGGLRGAISLALAISLPASLGPARDDIQTMAFGVVLFTLLVQGLTMKPLINKMNLIQHSEAQEEYERRHARSVMAKTSYDQLSQMYQQGYISSHVWDVMSKPIKQHADALADAVTDALHADSTVEEEVFDTAMKEILLAQRSSLNELLQSSIISEETYALLLSEVDTAITEPRSNLVEAMIRGTGNNIQSLMAIIVQETDVENIIAVLNRMGVPITRLSSSGGFLAGRNTTLLVGVPKGKDAAITSALSKASRQRLAFISGTGDESKSAASVTVGATIFSFDVERYEEL
jgi:NhaP-type Na+/H+ or K+/H+ antiporter